MDTKYNSAKDVIHFVTKLKQTNDHQTIAKLVGKYLVSALEYCSGSSNSLYGQRILLEKHLYFGMDCDISSADHFDRTWKHTLTNVTNKKNLDNHAIYYVPKFNTQAVTPDRDFIIKLLQNVITTHYNPIEDSNKHIYQETVDVYKTLGIMIKSNISIKLASKKFLKHQTLNNLKTKILLNKMQNEILESKINHLDKMPVKEFKLK